MRGHSVGQGGRGEPCAPGRVGRKVRDAVHAVVRPGQFPVRYPDVRSFVLCDLPQRVRRTLLRTRRGREGTVCRALPDGLVYRVGVYADARAASAAHGAVFPRQPSCALTAGGLIVLTALPLTPLGGAVDFTAPPAEYWIVLVCIVTLYIIAAWAVKKIYVRRYGRLM